MRMHYIQTFLPLLPFFLFAPTDKKLTYSEDTWCGITQTVYTLPEPAVPPVLLYPKKKDHAVLHKDKQKREDIKTANKGGSSKNKNHKIECVRGARRAATSTAAAESGFIGRGHLSRGPGPTGSVHSGSAQLDLAPALAHFGVELSGLGLEDFPFEVRRKLLRPAFTKLPKTTQREQSAKVDTACWNSTHFRQ